MQTLTFATASIMSRIMLVACERNFREIVSILLNGGANINVTDGSPSPLIVSAGKANSGLVKELLNHGAEINSVDRYGNTALHSAVLKIRYSEYSTGDVISTIRTLLNHGGANLDALNRDGETALYLACSCTSERKYYVVQMLLQSGADPNFVSIPEHPTEISSRTRLSRSTYARVVCRTSLLSYAARHQDVTLMTLLLKFGAQLELTDTSGKTALFYALEPDKRNSSSYNTASLQLLLKSGAQVNVLDDAGVSPLTFACSRGVLVLVKSLLSFGADPNLTTTAVYPLSLACQFRYYEIVKLLLVNGADTQVANSNSEPALCDALTTFDDGDAGPDSDLAQLLLDHGADPNVMTSLGETPLYLACLNNLLALVQRMLKCGAEVNISKSQKSPLNAACSNQHMRMVELLLSEGADPNVPEEIADTSSFALHIAVSGGGNEPFVSSDYNDIVDTLLTHTMLLCRYSYTGNNELVKLLLQHGANVHVADESGNTALHHVMKTCNRFTRESILDTLLKAGADVNVCNNDGESPLYLAVHKYVGVVKFYRVHSTVTNLLEHGADPNSTTTDKFPLSVACETQNFSLVDTLLDAGANPNLTAANAVRSNSSNHSGSEVVITCELPLCIALKKRDQRLTELLLNIGAKVNLLNSLGKSALHFAVENMVGYYQRTYDWEETVNASAKLMKLLLKHGADVNQLMADGNSVLLLLLNYLKYNFRPLSMPTWIQYTLLVDETLKIMVSKGANLADSCNNLGHDFRPEELGILQSLCVWCSTDHVVVDLLKAGAGFKLLAYSCMRMFMDIDVYPANSVRLCQAAIMAGYAPSSEEVVDMHQFVSGEDSSRVCRTVELVE